MTDEYGDPDIDPEAATADAVLRDVLGDVGVPDTADDPDRASMIEVVIATAWPDGTPPTAEELTHDPDFAAVMEIDEAPGDVQDIADTDDYDAPETSDDDVAEVADDVGGWGDGDDSDVLPGPDEQG